MATNALTIPVRGRDLRVIPAERELRPKWVYEDGKRTDKPAVDDKGRPLYGITALIDSDFTGPVDGCRITVATPNLPPVAFGQILHLTDDAVIKVMNNSKGFELLISVQASGFVSDRLGSARSTPRAGDSIPGLDGLPSPGAHSTTTTAHLHDTRGQR